MQLVTIDAFVNFVEENKDIIEEIEVTSITDPFNFNNMEGYQYHANIRITTDRRYRNKLLSIYFNSSYFDLNEEMELQTPQEFVHSLIEELTAIYIYN